MKPKRLTNAELLKRIDALEAEVRELKARPVEQHTHFHTHPVDPARLPWAPPQQPGILPYTAPLPYAVPYWGTPTTLPPFVVTGAGDQPNNVTVSVNSPPEDNAGGVLAKVS